MEFNIIKRISRGKLVGKEEEICDMYFNQRKTLVEVAEAFGCDNKFIRTIFKNNNLKPEGIPNHKYTKILSGMKRLLCQCIKRGGVPTI